MRGGIPKNPQTRQRRNKVAGARTLAGDTKVKEPKLPRRDGGWSQMTKEFWKALWGSEMAPEFLKVDLHGLYVLADLVEQYWEQPTTALAAEIRLQRQNFGLTPMDRHRLQWEVIRAEKEKTRTRRVAKKKPTPKVDPRTVLRMVK